MESFLESPELNLEGKSCSELLSIGLPKFVNHLLSLHLATKKVKVVTNPTSFMTSELKQVNQQKIHRYFCQSCFQDDLESLKCYSCSLANEKGLLPENGRLYPLGTRPSYLWSQARTARRRWVHTQLATCR